MGPGGFWFFFKGRVQNERRRLIFSSNGGMGGGRGEYIGLSLHD